MTTAEKIYPVYIAHVQTVLKRNLTPEECERAEVLRNEGKSIHEIADAIEPPVEFVPEADGVQFVNVLGRRGMPMNVWGKTTLLLGLLRKAGSLPECSISQDGTRYFINGHFVGRTEEEVTTSIWKMVACNEAHGYLFE